MSVQDITDRFKEEKRSISQYIDYVGKASGVSSDMFDDINSALLGNGINPIAPRVSSDNCEPFTQSEIRRCVEQIKDRLPLIANARRALNYRYRETAPIDFSAVASEIGGPLKLWVAYFVEQSISLPSDASTHTAFVEAAIEQSRLNWLPVASVDTTLIDFPSEHEVEARRIVIPMALKEATRQQLWNQIQHLGIAEGELSLIAMYCRMELFDAEVNRLRQGFILLMTVFDAVVFDLVRAALRANFFGLIGSFEKDEKKASVPLREMSKYKDAEDFKERVIEIQLKRLYLRDLLSALKRLGARLLPRESEYGDHYVFELVLRRNIHIHNRGVVDLRYTEQEDAKNSSNNPDGLEIGEVAPIDEAYWRRVNTLTEQCVLSVAAWAREQTAK